MTTADGPGASRWQGRLSQAAVTQLSQTPFGEIYVHKTPPSPRELESGQNELQSGQNGPHLGKMFEKWVKLF